VKKALITGATGFIGGRLAEATCALGVPTVAVVRQWSRAARLSRLPVDLAAADILDAESMRRAMAGCEVVFHCAVDFRRTGRAHRRSSVTGTRNVLQTALDAGVRRVVYLSTTAVFGRTPPPGVLAEDAATSRTGAMYGDAKLDAERIALDYHRRGLPVAILRPTIVYGPFSRTWVEEFAAAIRDGRMVLVNGGAGTCNALYVDNLVEAMLLAARHPAAPGEIFHISDARTVTWREFLEALARALGEEYLPLPEMTTEEIDAVRAQASRRRGSSLAQTLRLLADPRFRATLRTIPLVGRLETVARGTARTLLPEAVLRRARETASAWRRPPSGGGAAAPVRPLLRPSLISLLASTTTFGIDKARRILGYDPRIDFQTGMRLTAAWIRWAGL
jgi:nucleoside-diphosphate-sugar epimerase